MQSSSPCAKVHVDAYKGPAKNTYQDDYIFYSSNISLLIIWLEVVMVTKPWYVKKLNRSSIICTSHKPFSRRNRSHVRPARAHPSRNPLLSLKKPDNRAIHAQINRRTKSSIRRPTTKIVKKIVRPVPRAISLLILARWYYKSLFFCHNNGQSATSNGP
jgi:hypothetical protein